MATRLIFPNWLIAHFAARFTCSKCGHSDGTMTVHYPFITRRGDQVELRFPTRCACGQAGSFRVRLPLLLFGFLLAWLVLIDADQRARNSVATLPVLAHKSPLFRRLVGEYMQLISRLPAGAPAEPSAADQVALELGDDEWAQFLKRMGFNGGAPAES